MPTRLAYIWSGLGFGLTGVRVRGVAPRARVRARARVRVRGVAPG